MTRTVVKRVKALWDIIGIAELLGRDDPAVAERFMDAVEASREFLRDFPESGAKFKTKNERMRDARLWPVKGFPNHLINFRPQNDLIEVLRVCHGARNLDDLP